MNSPKVSISIVTAGIVIFTVLCNSRLNIPTAALVSFLLVLHGGMVWMLITILKSEKASGEAYEENFFDDLNLKDKE